MKTVNHLDQNKIVKILQPQIHTILKNARFDFKRYDIF